MFRFIEKQKVIETRFRKDDEDSFNDAIAKLNDIKMSYVVREERKITSLIGLGYFIYSIILDLFVLGAVIYAFIKWT
jgi:hypothetical protein|tara:strand:+ start:101 stop:331 length:231 start_codon:yes stop_codon:yes gene_type:complete